MIPDQGDYGFICGNFSVALSGNGFILPGSKGQPLKRSQLPMGDMNETTGMFTLRATHGGSVICDLPVHVVWASHPTQSEPFLAFKSAEVALIETLRKYQGKAVELIFTKLQSETTG